MMMASRVSLNLPLPRPDLKSEKLESLGNVHDPGFLPLWESMWYLDRRVGRRARRYWPRDILFENFPQRQGSLRR
jgi:hypothetical protein